MYYKLRMSKSIFVLSIKWSGTQVLKSRVPLNHQRFFEEDLSDVAQMKSVSTLHC